MRTSHALSLIFLITLASCDRTKDVICDTGRFNFTGVGFSVADFNGATLRQYEAGSNFTKLKQQGNVSYYLWVRESKISDSGNVEPPPSMAVAHNPLDISASYDYVLCIPAAGISDTISNVTHLGPSHKVMSYSNANPAFCVNEIGSYRYNSQTITTNSPGHTNHLIYLVK